VSYVAGGPTSRLVYFMLGVTRRRGRLGDVPCDSLLAFRPLVLVWSLDSKGSRGTLDRASYHGELSVRRRAAPGVRNDG
jgi:hypothetical protein